MPPELMVETIVASAATFWVLGAVAAVLLCIAANSDSFFWGVAVTVAGLLGFQLLTTTDPLGYIENHPKDIALWAAAYLPIGIAWSFFRWWRVLKNKGAEILADKADFKPGYGGKTWKEFVDNRMPKAGDNKQRIVCWIMYWPFSAASYVLFDILCDIGNWLYAQLSGLYTRMADHVKASIYGDLT